MRPSSPLHIHQLPDADVGRYSGLRRRDRLSHLPSGARGESGDEILVLIGNGDGTFAAQPVVPVGTAPTSIVVADFDGDDRDDLAVACWNSSPVSRSRGLASGMAGADFHGDALLDVPVSNTGGDDVTILLNQSGPETLTFTADAGTLVWPAVIGVLSYNVYRGNVAALVDTDEDGLPDSGCGTCMTALDTDPTDTFFDDPDIAAAEAGFFYLRSVVDAGGESGLGTTSAGLPRVPTVVCP